MNIETFLAQGQRHEGANELNHASNCYHQILAENPKHVPALKRLGFLAMRRGDIDEAKVLLKWAHHLAPNDIDITTAWIALYKKNCNTTKLNSRYCDKIPKQKTMPIQSKEICDNIPEVEFLNGEKFSNGATINYTSSYRYLYLKEYLIEKLNGKRVIHIGACDHANLVGDKIKKGEYYHKIITDASEQCIGVDIDKSTINFLKSNYYINNIIYHDIENDNIPNDIRTNKWDYLLALDVVEHIDNPVRFLKKLNEKFFKYANKIIVTVPNAFKIENFINSMNNKEVINTDHRYWFTPYTISKVTHRSGLIPKKILMIQRSSTSNINCKVYPFFRDTILIECELNNE